MTDAPVTWHDAGDRTVQIVLDHAPANALGAPIVAGLARALDAVESQHARVVLVTSALPRIFVAGADIRFMADATGPSFAAYRRELCAVMDRLATPERVTIAVVEGVALGGGLELAMACTLRVGGRDARFGLPEVKLGLIPGAGGTQRLPPLVGRGRALDMMLTGRQVGAEEAHAIGLIDRLVDAGDATDAALELAGELRGASPHAQRAVIRAVDASFGATSEGGLAVEGEQVQAAFEHHDAREGFAAFLAKRPPEFE